MKELQNGSDIRALAVTTDHGEAQLTPEVASEIASGIADWLKNEKQVALPAKIAVGHDSRITGPAIKDAMCDSFSKMGFQVLDVGLATTPSLFMATQFADFDCAAGIMITASHLPYYYNGIKVFSKSGGAEKEDIAYILAHAAAAKPAAAAGTIAHRDLISEYAADLVEKIRKGSAKYGQKPLEGFKIIVDAGNGAGGFFADKVLKPLGADTTGSQFLTPDGHFPNHIPNPDNKEAMASIRSAVAAQNADLGVIFDTDVDRAAVVDSAGEALNRNNLIAVLAQIVLAEHPHTSIVTNSPTSSHLKTFIEGLGGKQVRFISGYRNVINKAIELNEEGTPVELAIETSGHAAFKENYFLDDGAYVIAKILMLLPKLREEHRTLGELIRQLKQPVEAQEVRFTINAKDVRGYGENVIRQMSEFAAATANWQVDPENHEGIRVNVSGDYGTGWFLLRMSLHEPLLVLQAENDVTGKNLQVLKRLYEFFTRFDELDLSKLMPLI
ncbi:MAG: phosphomannomutase/phosphoglucomutase [Enterococcaceae bacterium]|jgi:phosphomannomutase|nr:phosphomannomutase/phosphoglucomutase [Enterococcaceae bacterium]